MTQLNPSSLTTANPPVIHILASREKLLKSRHLWLFSGALEDNRANQPIDDGCFVHLHGAENRYLASAHFQNGAIACRILGRDSQATEWELVQGHLQRAFELRNIHGFVSASHREVTNGFRLVHGEGDFLPGLVIDYYNGHIVLQPHTRGMYRLRHSICQWVVKQKNFPVHSVFCRATDNLGKQDQDVEDSWLFGCSGRQEDGSAGQDVEIQEHGILYQVDIPGGQKTGFFLDQRDARLRVRELAQNRRVLNLFCYSGGFSLNALCGGAAQVISVDSSKKAIQGLEQNLSLNNYDSKLHKSACMDVFDWLKEDEVYQPDMVIVDPPSFARHQKAKTKAIKAYARLNRAAMRKLQVPGLLFTFSCSQAVGTDDFLKALRMAASETGRSFRILQRFSQGVDHPVNLFHPETHYLKGFLLYVE